MGVAHRLLDFIMGEPWADLLGQIRQLDAQSGGFGYVFFQLRKVHLVVGVGDSVVIFEIVCLLLLGHESGHALQHEIEVVGTPLHVGLEFFDVKLRERGDKFLRSREHIDAAAYREAGCLSRTRIVDNDPCGLVEFGAVIESVCAGAEQSLFLARKKNEANGASRLHARSLDGTQRIHDQGSVAAVVECARAQFPGIEVRAQDYEFVRLPAASNFCNHVGGLDGAADLIGNGEIGPH